jgi:hypothetical protein
MAFFETDPQLQEFGDRLINAISLQFDLSRDQTALTLLVYDRPSILNLAADEEPQTFWQRKIRGFGHRGIEIIYPAGIANLFYMVALQEWLDTGMIAATAEIDRALADAIVNMSYDASNYIIDLLSGTTSGPEISDGPFATWQYQRQIVNRYFHNLGIAAYKPINVCQKLWRHGPYGRERTFHGDLLANRNMLTTNATAHLLYGIITGITISQARSQVMQNLLQRSLDPDLASPPSHNQAIAQMPTGGDRLWLASLNHPEMSNNQHQFLGEVLPPQTSLWALADHSMEVSNQVMHVEIADRHAFTLAIFCESNNRDRQTTQPVFQQICQYICQQIIATGSI